jgi:hypothetical protein
VLCLLVAGCDDDSNDRLLDAGDDDLGSVDVPTLDRGVADVGAADAGIADAGADVAIDRGAATDVGSDLGSSSLDAGAADAGAADAGRTDSSIADAGGVDAGAVDAGAVDTGTGDAGTTDSGASDSGTGDAGSARGTPTIDGVIGSDWPAGALVATNAVPSEWGPTLNALRSVRVAWDADRLYLGVDGAVEATNAMLVFIDRDFQPGMAATGVTAISTLTDGAGALDNSISCNVTESLAGFGTDMVWGTRGMLRKSATELVDTIGLRDVSCAACRGDFRWTMGDAAVCVGGATPACEVAIPWTALYGGAAPPVPMLGLFVRITNAEGASLANNQCLPQQGPADPPTAARRVLAFSPTF